MPYFGCTVSVPSLLNLKAEAGSGVPPQPAARSVVHFFPAVRSRAAAVSPRATVSVEKSSQKASLVRPAAAAGGGGWVPAAHTPVPLGGGGGAGGAWTPWSCQDEVVQASSLQPHFHLPSSRWQT